MTLFWLSNKKEDLDDIILFVKHLNALIDKQNIVGIIFF